MDIPETVRRRQYIATFVQNIECYAVMSVSVVIQDAYALGPDVVSHTPQFQHAGIGLITAELAQLIGRMGVTTKSSQDTAPLSVGVGVAFFSHEPPPTREQCASPQVAATERI